MDIDNADNLNHIKIKDEATGELKKEYILPFNAEVRVKKGDKVTPGVLLNSGSVYPQDILRVQGVKGVQDYILEQVQSVYRSQGVDINDKHIEIIVRQMLKKVRVENAGDTGLLPGELVDMTTFQDECAKAMQKGGAPRWPREFCSVSPRRRSRRTASFRRLPSRRLPASLPRRPSAPSGITSSD